MDNEKKKWMVVTTVVAVVSLLVGGIVTLLFRPAVSGSSIVELPADGSPAPVGKHGGHRLKSAAAKGLAAPGKK